MKKDRPLVCLPIEIKVREFDARLYLGLKAASKGFNALVGDKSTIKSIATRWPTLFFCKGATAQEIDFYRAIQSAGGKIVRLDEEGGVFEKDASVQFRRRFPKVLMEILEYVYLWGEHQSEQMSQAEHLKPFIAKFYVTGHPRFDLRKQAFGSVYKEINNAAMTMCPYVLINSTFGCGNPMNGVEYELKYRQEDDPEVKTHFIQQHRYAKEMLKGFVVMVKSIAAEFEYINFIYRPHPHEKLAYYDGLFDDCPNIKVIATGSVQEWIVNAECIVHHDCTTAIEAFIYGKPVFSYLPYFDDRFLQDMPPRVSIIATSIDEMKKLLHAQFSGSALARDDDASRRDKADNLKKLIANVDFSSAERIVESIATIPVEPYAGDLQSLVKKKKQPVGSTFKRIWRSLFPKKVDPSDVMANQKFPGLTLQEVEIRVRLFSEADPSIVPVSILPINNSTYVITPKG